MLNKTTILNVSINYSSKEEILNEILIGLGGEGKKRVVMTPNPELLVMASESKSYQNILNSADFSLPDGIGVVMASKFLGKEVRSRITGVDFMKSFCEKVSNQTVMTGFFGAMPGIAEQASNCLKKTLPNLHVSYASHLPPDFKNNNLKIDILFVALGSPKQEQWIADNIDQLPVKVVMGVGGSFDMISGKTKRAPQLVQKIGFEWLWRLITQPWRWKRQIKLLTFISLVLKEKFKSTK